MPTYGVAIKTSKIPIIGLVPEQSATAPGAPADGQLYTNTTSHIVQHWDSAAATWIPWLRIGTAAGTAAAGNDARLSDQRVPTDNSVTGGTAGAGVKIAAATITDVNVAAANKDGVAATPSLRTLGTAATQATAGNDARLSDTRTPTVGSVVDASVSGTAAIAESKLALASDAVATTASRRTIGTGALQAMAGSTRLDTIAAPTSTVGLNGQRITNLAASVAATDAVNRSELDSARQGFAGAKDPVRVATNANVALLVPGATIDGVTLAANDRFLAYGQTAVAENGIYVFNGSAAAATRATDADALGEVKDGTTVAAAEGASAGAIFIETATLTGAPGAAGGVQTWVAFSTGGAVYTGTANRITVTGSVIDISAAYAGQASITTLGTVTTGTWNGTAISVANGGTGATAPAAARTNLGAAQAGLRMVLGALTAGTALTVTHNLNTDNLIAQVRDATTGEYIYLDIFDAPGTPNTLTVTAGIAFAASALDIVLIAI